jgi:hypothetical protein
MRMPPAAYFGGSAEGRLVKDLDEVGLSRADEYDCCHTDGISSQNCL